MTCPIIILHALNIERDTMTFEFGSTQLANFGVDRIIDQID